MYVCSSGCALPTDRPVSIYLPPHAETSINKCYVYVFGLTRAQQRAHGSNLWQTRSKSANINMHLCHNTAGFKTVRGTKNEIVQLVFLSSSF